MNRWHCALMVLAGPAVGLAIELEPGDSLLATPIPFTGDSLASGKEASEPAAATNTAAPALLSPRQRFLEFATRPLFPWLPFGPQDRLKSCTHGLDVEEVDGQWLVSTPVGLGLSDPETRAWLASMPEALSTNLDLFEFSYRATLVPRELGGPGFTFDEAKQTALRLTLAGETWSQPNVVLEEEPCEPAWMGSLRVPLIGAMPGAPANEYNFGPTGPFDAFPPGGYWEGHGHHHGGHDGGHHGGHGSGHHGCHPR
jgi:hypothetical protein